MTHEVNTVITGMTTDTRWGQMFMSNKVTESYASAKEHIRAMAEYTKRQPTWSSFHDRNGYLVEKAAYEWTSAYGARCTDVVWVRRGWTRQR
jgi:hypothetical protein